MILSDKEAVLKNWIGFPKRHHENWKYTSVDLIANTNYLLTNQSDDVLAVDISSYVIENTYRLVFVDGKFSPQLSNLNDLPPSVILKNTVSAAQNSDLETMDSPFISLNSLLINEGLFLSIPDNMVLEKPIHLLYISSNESVQAMRHPRHWIQLGHHSQSVLFEEYVGSNNRTYFNNVVTRIDVSENAQLHYYKLQRESMAASHIASTIIHQEKDSCVHAFHIATGARLSRDDVQFNLQGTGARCHLSGFYYPQQAQHIDYHTCIHHYQPHTQSEQYYKGIMADKGRGVFNGKIIVHPQAEPVIADQTNHNLLLSNTAEIDTKPELQVFAEDVKCTHGATVGSLDPDALFYLRSRGIGHDQARHLLLCGFVNELLDRLIDLTIAQSIRSYVVSQLSTSDCLGACDHV